MNRRAFASKAILATALIAFAATAATAHAGQVPTKGQKLRPIGPKAPTGYVAPGTGGAKPTAGINHDSDDQLDIWVQRCNDAGGGMSTGGDGNYTCTDANGNEIEDY